MYTNRHIWKISYPIFLSLLAQNVINVTDTAFLGRVGEVELGASAMGGLYYICIFTIAFGFSTGSQILIGRRNGERNCEAVGPVVIQGVFFLIVLAAVIFLFSRLMAGSLMRALISSEAVRTATLDFLDWRVYGFFFSFVNVMFRAFFVGIIRTKVLTWNALLMAGINVILDYLLIFGHAGLPRMGIQGAAIASVIAEGASVVFFLVYTLLTVDRKQYGLHRIPAFDPVLLKQVLNISVFMMMQQFASMSTFFLLFIVVERLGQRELAIANIIRSVYVVMFIPVNALATTTNTLVSNIMGEGRVSQVIPLIRHMVRLSVSLMACFSLLLCIFPRAALSIYTNDAALLSDSMPSLYVIAVTALVCSMASVVFNGLSGTGNTRPAFVIELGVLVIYLLFIYVAGVQLRQPVHICYLCEFVYFLLLLTGCVLYFRFAAWEKNEMLRYHERP
ncbi:MAG: MATE family efflux transporter [Tannerella sp.]|jgi:putative MATE family efflux protein|nr:MATE family efflux transporter [Tannerella sp.]